MATSFTGLSEAQIDDYIIDAIQAALPYLRSFSTQLDHPEGLIKGNSYIVPVSGLSTVANKTPGTFASASGTLTGVPVEADNFLASAFDAVEGVVSARTMAAWWSRKIRETTLNVAAACVDDALALITAANYGDTSADKVVQAMAGFKEETLGDLRAIAKAKLKRVPGAFVCGPVVASKLVVMQQIVLALAIADDRNSISDGRIPGGMLGYTAYEYADFPNNSENLVAAIIGESAIAMVAGAPEQLITSGLGNVTYRRIVTEPESGLSLQYTEIVDGGGKVSGEVAILEGAVKAQDTVVRLVTE